MHYIFPSAILIEDRYRLNVQNVSLEIVQGTIRDEAVKNDCFNGKVTIKGVLDNLCLRNQSKIKPGLKYTLRLCRGSQWTLLPVVILGLDKLGESDGTYRSYTWAFCGCQKPQHDRLEMLPGSNGEVSLDDLLALIGADRSQMEKNKVAFTREGGMKNAWLET